VSEAAAIQAFDAAAKTSTFYNIPRQFPGKNPVNI
jgi:hypothetical protein